jgi:NADH:ubiquinone oxidoreductase subunit 6 (subunit J)
VDVLLTIAFYVCAGLALAGALSSALLSGASPWRLPALLAVAVGTTGVLASLSAGFAAVVTLVCLVTTAVLLSGPRAGAAALGAVKEHRWPAQVGAVAAAGLFAALAYAAVRGDFVRGAYPGGWFGAAFLGRLLFTRDAIALQAVAFALLVGLLGLTGIAARARGGR